MLCPDAREPVPMNRTSLRNQWLIALVAVASGASAAPPVPRVRVLDLNREGASGLLTEPIGRWFTPTPYGGCFVATTSDAYRQVWQTDGTPDGTRAFATPADDPDEQGTPILLCAGDGSGVCFDLLFRSDGTSRIRRLPPPPPSPHAGPTTVVQNLISGFSPTLLAATADVLYYAVPQDLGSVQLWRTDGTEQGTWLIRVFFSAGLDGAGAIDQATILGQHLLFTYNDGVNGRELWISTGAAGGTGTVILADLAPGGDGSRPGNFTRIGDLVYFAAESPQHGSEPYITDGTEEGTRLLADLGSPSTPEIGSEPAGFTPVWLDDGSGGQRLEVLFSAASTTTGRELWRTDGTPEGTRLVVDINPGSASSLTGDFAPAIVGDQVFFAAEDGIHGRELWAVNLMTSSARQMADLVAGPGGSNPLWITRGGPTIFFESAADGAGGGGSSEDYHRVFACDPATGAVQIACDLRLGPEEFLTWPRGLVGVGAGVVFPAYRPDVGRELFSLDGSAPDQPAQLLKNVHIGTLGSNPGAFVDLGDRMLFSAQTPDAGREPWFFDLFQEQADALLDIAPGPTTSTPVEFITGAGYAIFLARPDPELAPYHWYLADGTADPLDTRALGLNGVTNFTTQGTAIGSRVIFAASDPDSGLGTELYTLTATPAGPLVQLVKDLAPGETSSSPAGFVRYWGPSGPARALFYAANRSQLWSTDGTEEGTWLVKTFEGAISTSRMAADYGTGRVYFVAGDAEAGAELWSTDGSPEGSDGTGRVRDVRPGPASGVTGGVVFAGGRVYFTAFDPATGFELWSSDGTSEGTSQVKDLWPGASSGFPSSLTGMGGRVFFIASEGPSGGRLWVSDGTEQGTRPLSTAQAAHGQTPTSIRFAARGRVYFNLTNPRQLGAPSELWMSDGTDEGTLPVLTRTGPIPINSIQTTTAGSPRVVRSRVFLPILDSVMGVEPAMIDLCPADLNNSGGIDVGDIFQFLQIWTASSQPHPIPGLGPAVDFNTDGAVSLDDFFTFIEEYFRGCQ